MGAGVQETEERRAEEKRSDLSHREGGFRKILFFLHGELWPGLYNEASREAHYRGGVVRVSDSQILIKSDFKVWGDPSELLIRFMECLDKDREGLEPERVYTLIKESFDTECINLDQLERILELDNFGGRCRLRLLIHRNSTLFKRVDKDRIKIRSEDEIKKIRERLKDIEDAKMILTELIDNERVEDPPEKARWFLIDCYVKWRRSEYYPHLRELLAGRGVDDPGRLKDLLIQAGLMGEHFLPDLYTEGFVGPIGEDENRQLQDIVKAWEEITKEGYQEVGFTVDKEGSEDLDDAISIRREGDRTIFGIHISDIRLYVDKDSPLDRLARRRGQSLYLAEGQVNMFPDLLAERVFSLKEGGVYPVVSFYFNQKGTSIELTSIVFQNIFIKRNFSYGEAEDSSSEEIKELKRLGRILKGLRMVDGAQDVLGDEVDVKIKKGEVVVLKDPVNETKIAIAELMILLNSSVAEYCHREGIPFLYNRQDSSSVQLDDGGPEAVNIYRFLSSLKPVYCDTTPGLHFTLNKRYYCKISSPIRRYMDLVLQRQLASFLIEGRPVYSSGELKQLDEELSPVMQRGKRIQSDRKRFWILKYLKDRKMHIRLKGYRINERRVLLPDYGIVAGVHAQHAVFLRSGQRFYRIIHIDLDKKSIFVAPDY